MIGDRKPGEFQGTPAAAGGSFRQARPPLSTTTPPTSLLLRPFVSGYTPPPPSVPSVPAVQVRKRERET
ncbi:hypothetical protein HanOQP8_Chr13g0475191 [Helianthus annuus]|nr:hypothetical protein HanIR_Chr13g0629721 [Helianthus annuus]KAJ0663018.1 hypothetical protein HanLR1_Chr13g0476411 [Helianthus annuus]KAJ0670513.1 hypothetical protein HanOQP8_Chr13g0475191 [Helianthus annuus]KAJ0848388.1 hypothetical protein HanPSC8_Chr13g0556701 [Helianthus annuus]